MLLQTDKAKNQVDTDQVKFETDKFCIHCKHFAGSYRHKSIFDSDHGNCAFRMVRWQRTSVQCKLDIIQIERCPISGDLRFTYKHHNCYDVRRDSEACGPDGKWFEEYIEQKYIPPPKVDTIGGQEAVEVAFDETALEAGKAAAKARLEALRARKK